MSSQRQIEANRLNAQRSTGPRTAAGKAASCMNALKSGIHAESQVIIGESADALTNLTAEYHSRYHPTTPEQRALVDTLISSEWLLRRLRQAEAQIWNNGLQFLEESEYQDKRHPIGDTFASRQETMARLQRRIDSTDRAFHRALRALRQLQSETVEPAAPPEHLDPPPATPPATRCQRTRFTRNWLRSVILLFACRAARTL